MSRRRPLAAGSRPSMRDIAEVAGVSAMTVSKALRNSPKIARRTRERILKIAGRLGYRPDPELTKLMNHLRSRTKPVFQGLICALTDRPAALGHPYLQAMAEGARRRAESRGYGFDLMHFEEDQDHGRQLRRVLWARGAQGVLLLPLQAPVALEGLLPWKDISAVAATSSILSPDLHRVTPNHYANTLQLCDRLAARGYRRIGLVIDAVQDMRVNHAFSAAVTWHSFQHQDGVVPPLIFSPPWPSGLAAWFRRERPDALIASDHLRSREYAATLGLPLGGPVAFVSTYTDPASGLAGIDELPGEIAATAVDHLAGMIQHAEKGIPAHATATLLSGNWVEGLSCPPKARRRARR
ncbi:MAG TPA: LacI family DNA-binding transcriptional regulator [Opitutaceae bacterium]|nr:LacI family DNA-binding transcriptional regulator [Opitutaceae bacterium]